MIPGQRRSERNPGDLYLDPAVPVHERMTASCGDWMVQVTHVWTGYGWSRLVPGQVQPVPASSPLPLSLSA